MLVHKEVLVHFQKKKTTLFILKHCVKDILLIKFDNSQMLGVER